MSLQLTGRIRGFIAGALIATLSACGSSASQPKRSSAPANPDIVVGPNIQVSKQNSDHFHGEVLMGTDPINPKHLIACSAMWPVPLSSGGGAHDVTYVSFDGGLSWKPTFEDKLGAYALDAACRIGFDGNALTGGAAVTHPAHDFVVHSSDGGLHWDKPLVLPWGDRDFISIDTSAHSPYRGRVYYTALNLCCGSHVTFEHLGAIHSDDGGKAFSTPVIVKNTPVARLNDVAGRNESGPSVVLANGHVVVLDYEWPSQSEPRKIEAYLSKDGGASFGLAGIAGMRIGSPLLDKGVGVTMLPVIAADASYGPFKNRLYVAWQDQANGSQSRIALASSDDEGKTWTAPLRVDDAPYDPFRHYPIVSAPEIAVNKKGIMAVTWFDSRDRKDGEGGALRVAVSRDGGESFSSSLPIAGAATSLIPPSGPVFFGAVRAFNGNLTMGTDTRYHTFGGDTQALEADAAGNFHPVWIDNRSGISQVWTSGVSVRETAVRHGDPALASLKDVSSSIGFAITSPQYDPKTEVITGDVVLVNTSKSEISLPIRFRITRADSPLGAISVDGAENGLSGPGALFTFRSSKGSSLKPNGQTRGIHLVFHVSNPRQLTADDVSDMELSYISVNFRAYAK